MPENKIPIEKKYRLYGISQLTSTIKLTESDKEKHKELEKYTYMELIRILRRSMDNIAVIESFQESINELFSVAPIPLAFQRQGLMERLEKDTDNSMFPERPLHYSERFKI